MGYVHLEPEELGLLVAALSVLTIEPAKTLSAKLQKKIDLSLNQRKIAIDEAYLAAAREHHHEDLTCEIDDKALVSKGEDPGAYVMAWVWVDNAQAGICEDCGNPGANDGEGWDGLCGSCADKVEASMTPPEEGYT